MQTGLQSATSQDEVHLRKLAWLRARVVFVYLASVFLISTSFLLAGLKRIPEWTAYLIVPVAAAVFIGNQLWSIRAACPRCRGSLFMKNGVWMMRWGCPHCGLSHTRPAPIAMFAGYFGLLSILIIPAPFALLISIISLIRLASKPNSIGWYRSLFGLLMGAAGTVVLILLKLRVWAI